VAADDPGALEVLPAQGNVYVLAAAGGNTTVQIGSEGPLVVDTQPPALSDKVIESVGRLSPRPIRHIVLTSGGRPAGRWRRDAVEGRPLHSRD
jgi:glyoxylase-like metal-dependent hydrolase (beta-lactamase superfamily II)